MSDTPEVASTQATINGSPCVGTCKTCRHWEMLGVHIAGYCGMSEVVETSRVPAINGFGSRAIMPNENTHHVITGPDFGCIHWEQKP